MVKGEKVFSSLPEKKATVLVRWLWTEASSTVMITAEPLMRFPGAKPVWLAIKNRIDLSRFNSFANHSFGDKFLFSGASYRTSP